MIRIFSKTIRSILIFLVSIAFIACEKQEEAKTVTYQITRSMSGFDVNYKDETGKLIKETIQTNSADDVWSYSFKAYNRQIVFVSAIYKDISSALQVRILIDGKVYKQGSSKNDTIMYVTLGGSVLD